MWHYSERFGVTPERGFDRRLELISLSPVVLMNTGGHRQLVLCKRQKKTGPVDFQVHQPRVRLRTRAPEGSVSGRPIFWR